MVRERVVRHSASHRRADVLIAARVEFEYLVAENFRPLVAHVLARMWKEAVSVNSEAAVVCPRLKAHAISLDIGPVLAFRIRQIGNQNYFGISFDPSLLSGPARRRLRQLSQSSGPFVFSSTNVAKYIYETYLLGDLAEIWPLSRTAAVDFVRRAAESKSPFLRYHEPEFLNFILKI